MKRFWEDDWFLRLKDIMAYTGLHLAVLAAILFILRNRLPFIHSTMFRIIGILAILLCFFFLVPKVYGFLMNGFTLPFFNRVVKSEIVAVLFKYACIFGMLCFFVMLIPVGLHGFLLLQGFLLVLCLFIFYKFRNGVVERAV